MSTKSKCNVFTIKENVCGSQTAAGGGRRLEFKQCITLSSK